MLHGLYTRHDLLRLGGAALAAVALPWPLLAAAPGRPGQQEKHVLFFTKSAEYEHDIVRRDDGRLGLAETTLIQLGKERGMAVTASKDGTVFDRQLERYDAIVFYTTGDLTTPGEDQQPPMSPRGKAALLSAIKAGKGFVGIHCASDTFHSAGERYQLQEQKDPYIDMLGGEFISHGEQQQARLRLVDAAFPGVHMAGDGFVLYEEWYSLKNFAPDLHVILVLETAGMHGQDYQRPPYPAVWAHRYGDGRVFYTCMGHRADVWSHPLFQAILLGGMAWVLGEVDVDVSPNLPQVTPAAHTLPPPSQ
jgi:type 1 glutamine amidotransferase